MKTKWQDVEFEDGRSVNSLLRGNDMAAAVARAKMLLNFQLYGTLPPAWCDLPARIPARERYSVPAWNRDAINWRGITQFIARNG